METKPSFYRRTLYVFIMIMTVGENCQSGKWGPSCDKNCSKSCRNSLCSSKKGLCLDCADGFYAIKCDKKCPPNCIDRACVRYNVSCTKGCQPGSYGEKCQKNCSCPSGVCHRQTGSCIGHATSTAVKVKDDCPDDIQKRCLGRCEKSNDQTVCIGCHQGFSGATCSDKCPDNCRRCFQNDTASCTECKPGFTKCQKKCAGCNAECSQRDGTCKDGCINGYYTPSCTARCSTNCANTPEALPPCNQTNGFCLLGCNNGSYGKLCEKKCHVNCTVTAKYESCKEACKNIDRRECLPGEVSKDCRKLNSLGYPGEPYTPRLSLMATWVIVGIVVVCGLLILLAVCVVTPGRKKKRPESTLIKRRIVRERRCHCESCTDMHPSRFEGRVERDSRFVSSNSNRRTTWPGHQHHFTQPRDTRLNRIVEDSIYEEVSPVPQNVQ